jgi:hypothetical protein
MVRKVMMIGLLVMSAIALQVKDAHAQFDGWGWFGFSEVRGRIDTINTPNPQGQPSQVVVTVSAGVQIACSNPANNGIFPGKTFRMKLVGAANVTKTEGGKATTEVVLELDPGLVSQNCTHPNFRPILESAMALDFTGSVVWCLTDKSGALDCSNIGKSKLSRLLTKGKRAWLLDQDSVTCVLDQTNPANLRNQDGTAPKNAVFSCTAPCRRTTR